MTAKKLLLVVLPYLVDIESLEHKKTAKIRSFVSLPYGVLSIASYVKKKSNTEVKIFDCNLYGNQYVSEFKKEVNVFNPDIVGFSLMFDNSYKYLKDLVQIASHKKTVLGGAATAFAQKEILEDNIFIDAICNGEGEKPLLEACLVDNTSYFKLSPYWVTSEDCENKYYKESKLELDEIIDIDYSLVDTNRYKMEEAFSPHMETDINNKKQFFMVTTRGCNAKCLAGDTIIHTLYGDKTIKELYESNVEEISVLTYDKNVRDVFFTKAKNIIKTGDRDKLLRVHFDDGTYIDCTPDHKFLTFKNRNQFRKEIIEYEIEAQFLKKSDSVRAIKIKDNGHGYFWASWGRRNNRPYHQLIAEHYYDKKINKNEHVHHLDHNKKNNDPSNLIICSKSDHMKIYHSKEHSERMKKNNPVFNIPPEIRSKNSRKNSLGKRRSKEAKENYRKSKLGVLNPNYLEFTLDLSENLDDILYCNNLRDYSKQHGFKYVQLLKHFKIKYEKTIVECRKELGIQKKDLKDINHRVSYIEYLEGEHETYCLEVPEYHWFFANNVLVHNCSFCMNSGKSDRTIREASVDKVIEHVEYLVNNYGMDTLTFYDDQILYNRERAKELFKRLQKYNLRIEMPNGVSIAYLNEELCENMWKAGVKTLYLANESGSEYVLKNIVHKPLALKKVKPTIQMLRKHDFWILGYFVTGLPGETDEHRQETVDFIKDVEYDWISFSLASPVRGSKLYKECVENKYIDVDLSIGKFDMTKYIIKTPDYDPEYIITKNYRMNLECNFIDNYRFKIEDYKTARWVFEYVTNKYKDHAFGYYCLAKVFKKINNIKEYDKNMKIVKELCKQDITWKSHFDYFNIGV